MPRWILPLALPVVLAGCRAAPIVGPAVVRETRTTLRGGEVVEKRETLTVIGVETPEGEGKVSGGKVIIDGDRAEIQPPTREVPRQVASLGWLYWAGAGLIAAGALAAYLAGVKVGALLAAAGVGVLALTRLIDVYPWAAAVPLALVCLAGGVALLDLTRARRALGTVVAAVGHQNATEVAVEVDAQSAGTPEGRVIAAAVDRADADIL